MASRVVLVSAAQRGVVGHDRLRAAAISRQVLEVRERRAVFVLRMPWARNSFAVVYEAGHAVLEVCFDTQDAEQLAFLVTKHA